MKKASFIGHDRPLLCAMVQERTPDDMICTVCNAIGDGAEALGIQLECLHEGLCTEDNIRKIFQYCRGLPIYVTAYRRPGWEDKDCADMLLLAAKCGATMCDVMGDMFHPEPHEVTYDGAAVAKQKQLIAQLHAAGSEVLMSSHLHAFYREADVYKFARAQEERGADVVKIVNFSETEEELIENLRICIGLKRAIRKQYLYLANGEQCGILRRIGGALGCCMYLCVERYTGMSSKEQPLLRSMRAVRDNMG